ncbi:hypothetical protein SAMN06264855_1395 [Halorubrum vacuolatum]|uniref:Uncharacterized protein n=1 Tax=Halorubrum vacuolatum TaxID=63740 RepID=A0A238YE19_HALVU|nr:hypothetical protein SAMN06264855_1395 [Halorubrum vacuolatum]
MEIDSANEYLCEALEADTPTEKDYYIRQALQLLTVEELTP